MPLSTQRDINHYGCNESKDLCLSFLLAGNLFGLLLNPEDGDSMFLRNVEELL
jgi:hypothetical protein